MYLQSSQSGVVKTTFIRCCQVEQGTASGIVKAVETAVATVMEIPDFFPKLVSTWK